MKANTSTKLLLAMSVLVFVPLIVAWKWPWEFSWSGTWTGHGKMTVCGKKSAKSLDVSFNLNPSGEVIYNHGGLLHYTLGSLTIAPTGDDGALVGLIGDKLFGYLYPWEVYGELRKQTGPYASHRLCMR